MLRYSVISVTVIATLFLYSSCYSPQAVLQTARTTPAGSVEFSTGLTVTPEIPPTLSSQLHIGVSRISQVSLRYDAGFYWRWGRVGMSYKHNFWNSKNSNSYFSAGLGFNFEIHNYPSRPESWVINLPFYYSLNHNKKLTWYFNSNFMTPFSTFMVNDKDYTFSLGNQHGVGFQLGKQRVLWMVELFFFAGVGMDNFHNVNNTHSFYYDISHLATGVYIKGKNKPQKRRRTPGL